MIALPVTAGHEVTVQPVGNRFHAVCLCGWLWRSRFESVAIRQGDGHLYNEARKAA